MNISLSIITVCLNDRCGIERTAKSILSQTRNDFEWIVIDGNSTDGTVDVLKRYAARIDHFVSEPDEGIYDAMNKGIELSSGEYCLFINAGDSLYAYDVFEQLKPYLTTDLVIGQMMVKSPVDKKKNGIRRYDNQDIRKKYIYFKTLPHQATCIKRKLFVDYGLYDKGFVIAGDHDFFARVLLKGATINFVPFCVSLYMLDGISTKLKTSTLFDQERARIKKRNFSLLYRLWRKSIDLIEPHIVYTK